MSSCIRRTTKKYTSRPSPPYPANTCKNLIRKGNDGLFYQSLPVANGQFRWKKIKQEIVLPGPTVQKVPRRRTRKTTKKRSRKTSKKSRKTSKKKSRKTSKKKSRRTAKKSRKTSKNKSRKVGGSKKKSSKKKKRRDVKGLCKKRLQKKIEINMKEYEKDDKFVSREQALAVSYSQVASKYPECRRYYRR